MSKLAEIPRLVAEEFRIVQSESSSHPTHRRTEISQYQTPREIVFRDYACLLPAKLKEVMELAMGGMDNNQIALAMGIANNTVRNRINRIVRIVEDEFKSQEVDKNSKSHFFKRTWLVGSLVELGQLELRDLESASDGGA